MVFGNYLSSFGGKTIKRYIDHDYLLVKNFLMLQVCGKRWFQAEKLRFCEKWFFASDLSSFRAKTLRR